MDAVSNEFCNGLSNRFPPTSFLRSSHSPFSGQKLMASLFEMLQAVHLFFKEKLKFLITDTIDGPQDLSKCIRVRPNSAGNQNKGRNCRKRKERDDKPFDSRGAHDWPEHLGNFLRYCIIRLLCSNFYDIVYLNSYFIFLDDVS